MGEPNFDYIKHSEMEYDERFDYLDLLEEKEDYERKQLEESDMGKCIQNNDIETFRKMETPIFRCFLLYRCGILFAFELKRFEIFEILVHDAPFSTGDEFTTLLKEIEYPRRHESLKYRKVIVTKLKQSVLRKSISLYKNDMMDCLYCCTGLDKEEGLDNFMEKNQRHIYHMVHPTEEPDNYHNFV